MSKQYTAGSLVSVYDRDWVVQPSADKDLLLLKPLGGAEEESIAILRSLAFPDDKIVDTSFPYPALQDIADFASAKLLYEATRLLFRSGAGPFRSFGKLSFRPRSYQLVPLIMSLRQDIIRLLIADDVGIGKTIEAGLIVRELIDRGELKTFSVICLPHLCEQWQQELKSKFDIDTVIIRSGNISSLEKGLPPHTSIYRHYPFQIISIDYAKTENNRNWFLQECPDFIIVDEAHTCANTTGKQNSQQQLRYALLRRLANKPVRNMVLLTATPHSGKPLEFQSILGLLDKEFDKAGFDLNDTATIKKIVPHFIQRRRADIRQFLNEETPFSDRIPGDVEYELSNEYAIFFDKMIGFARDIVKETDSNQFTQRIKYWAALGLLRGVMSSPMAGISMLRNRAFKKDEREATELFEGEEIFDLLNKDRDTLPTDLLDYTEFKESEVRKLRSFTDELQNLVGIDKDRKARKTYQLIKDWLSEGLHPVIFCKYIDTAKYLGEILIKLKKDFADLEMEIITGEMHDEERKEKILSLSEKQSSKRLLVCTDCLSEGINLQAGFNALLHYDLPWNPNRLEQREGRIDRFGQTTKKVKTFLLYGKDNPIDGVVLRVLLRKAIEIKQQIGISVPFPEDSKSVMEAVSAAVLLNPALAKASPKQITLDFKDTVADEELKVGKAYEEARKKEEKLRSSFSQNKILEHLDIEADLKQTDEALGNPEAVEHFVKFAIEFLGGHIKIFKAGYKIQTGNLPAIIKVLLPVKGDYAVSFQSPTPEGFHYIGRNHSLVENLAQIIISGAFDHTGNKVARATLFRSDKVITKTVLAILRVRNVMQRKKGIGELVAEELVCWGYFNQISDENMLDHETVKKLLLSISASQDINASQQERFLTQEIEHIKQHQATLNTLVKQRSKTMVQLHTKYRKALGTEDYDVGTIVPPDVLGVYIVYPQS
jgi:superfamily II DNA or RNA helicase